jgi:hypothetical protein
MNDKHEKHTPSKKKGEGDYESAERYQRDASKFAHSGKVEPAAREAKAAREGGERREMDRAEKVGRSRAKEDDI